MLDKKKEKMMKRHLKLIIMAGILCVLVVVALVQKEFFPKDSEEGLSENGSVVYYAANDISADSLTGISYTLENKTLVFTKLSGDWALAEENAPAIDGELISAMAEAISTPSGRGRLLEVSAEKLSDYGLDEPSLAVSVETADGTRTFLFGALNKTLDEYYFAEEGYLNTVYTVSASAYEAFNYSLIDLIVPDSLPEIGVESITGFTIGDAEIKSVKTEVEEGFEYSAVRAQNGKEEEFSYADFYAVAEGVSLWSAEVVDCEYPVSEEYGLSEGRTFTVAYTEEEEAKSFSLILGEHIGEGQYYCLFDANSRVVYKITISEILSNIK